MRCTYIGDYEVGPRSYRILVRGKCVGPQARYTFKPHESYTLTRIDVWLKAGGNVL